MQFKHFFPFVLSAILITSCTKTELTTPAPDTQEMATARTSIDATNAMLSANTWTISSLVKHGSDLTSKFGSYNFTFAPNGTLTAVDGTNKLAGRWVTAYVDNTIRISLIFPNQLTVFDISGDWKITENTGQNIRMLDVVSVSDELALAVK